MAETITQTSKVVKVSSLSAALAQEVEDREDDEDWDMEDFSKAHIVAQLRSMPAEGTFTEVSETAYIEVKERDPVSETSFIDLSPGIRVEVLRHGQLARLEFALSCPGAIKRLALALEPESK
eukprot:TRINITY_DN117537_c0_g1_i1.p1 TRINITY_DN117537_c0_g1~~TRINITY_DN117537_c0_g1_i1.p1  ORF type:complete len:137 (+),score=23.45 TRINITY_DN117537_c0_g1_i1:48-413(+)